MNAYQFIVRMKDYASSELRNIARSAGVADRQVDDLNRSAGVMKRTFQGMRGIIAGALSVAAIGMFTGQVFEARSEYEKFRAVLGNTFQSSEVGDAALDMIRVFAAETPYQINELTGAFVKLVNRGFNPTRDQLTSLGDLAASQGKTFDQLTEAILDAQTGELERLKEFGITGSKSGDQLSLSFKGLTKNVAMNDEAIRNAILGYGQMDGVAGSMNVIAKTLGGQISNLKEKWNDFLVLVGGEGSKLFTYGIEVMSVGLVKLTHYIPVVSAMFGTLWEYTQPVVSTLWQIVSGIVGFVTAIEENALVLGLMTISLIAFNAQLIIGKISFLAFSIQFQAYTLWTKIATGAQWLFNAALSANPIGIVIGALAALAAGMVYAYQKVGWFRGGILATWESIKGFGSALKIYVIDRIQSILSGLTGMGRALKLLFDGEFNKAWEAGKKATADLFGMDDNKAFIENMKGVGKDAGMAYAKGVAEIDKDKGLKDIVKPEPAPGVSAYENYLANGGSAAVAGAKGTETAGKKTKGDSIVSGGSRQTNITVNIQKLQDDTKIYVSNTEQGVSNLGEKVQEMLLRAINSVNQMQTA